MKDRETWSARYKKCDNCGTNRHPHIDKGFCKMCYPLRIKLQQSQSWDMSEPKSLKGFPHFLRPFIRTQEYLDGFKNNAKEQIQYRLDCLKRREERLRGIITGIDVEYKLERVTELALRRRYKFGFFHGYATLIDDNFSGKQRKLIYSLLNKIEEALPWKGIRYGNHSAEAGVRAFIHSFSKR